MMISVGFRESKLAKKQVEEITKEFPHIVFQPITLQTSGDLDLESSLREKDKTDFFTKEIDELQLLGGCRISIHSAKDLPEPLSKGLKLVALTKGVDSSDSLVFRQGDSLSTVRPGSYIGSSSYRRDQIIKGLRPDLFCIEVRGTIEKRLEKLERGEIDGLVVAEAALIRLDLTHLNRIALPGKSAPLQGKLAVIAREDDEEMETLFATLDTREKEKRVLYLGIDPEYFQKNEKWTHYPIIKPFPRPFYLPDIRKAFTDIPLYTHMIFTSKMGVKFFFEALSFYGFTPDILKEKIIISIGKVTAHALEKHRVKATLIANEETQEGIIKQLAKENIERAYILIPCSSLARPTLSDFLMKTRTRHQLCFLYDTETVIPENKPNLNEFDEIIFTSPSTVYAFKKIFNEFPDNKKLTSIGKVTESILHLLRSQ